VTGKNVDDGDDAAIEMEPLNQNKSN